MLTQLIISDDERLVDDASRYYFYSDMSGDDKNKIPNSACPSMQFQVRIGVLYNRIVGQYLVFRASLWSVNLGIISPFTEQRPLTPHRWVTAAYDMSTLLQLLI